MYLSWVPLTIIGQSLGSDPEYFAKALSGARICREVLR
ncbi:hypothetical protein AvCA_43220 [Azotobacter vinelandii CA]|uniref:Uncharacterized protein n=2 Tax=Azotobacter vinelandii TaxID=354 RepID=C1DFP7_AZOVD|nr:hypothetical protein Avin_43220 [Azotobacter vinelandii DJ]AGK15998.1 hypothetical protein AvCA_43220 [Azotobacter vinelandii CA]AGK21920.1 hypothetical protein AvCA6_43220 [Azotobacter vinelandii CA6]